MDVVAVLALERRHRGRNIALEHGRVLPFVDELRLMIDPVVLGGGKRLFSDAGSCGHSGSWTTEVTSTGAILATYRPAG
jgi:hypothetical protein